LPLFLNSDCIIGAAKLARTNQSIANTGTYDVKDFILIQKATFAMNPMFVGGTATFRYALHSNTLILTGIDVTSSEGVLHPLYANGSHIVNKLVRVEGNRR
jgi:hypothetical protein